MVSQSYGDREVDEMSDELRNQLLRSVEDPYFPGALGKLSKSFDD